MKDLIEYYEKRVLEIDKQNPSSIGEAKKYELKRLMGNILNCEITQVQKEIELIKSTF